MWHFYDTKNKIAANLRASESTAELRKDNVRDTQISYTRMRVDAIAGLHVILFNGSTSS